MSHASLDQRKVVCKRERGAVCNQKGSPSVHWILGRLHAKNQGPKSRDKKDISLYRQTNRPTNRSTDGHEGSQESSTSKNYFDPLHHQLSFQCPALNLKCSVTTDRHRTIIRSALAFLPARLAVLRETLRTLVRCILSVV